MMKTRSGKSISINGHEIQDKDSQEKYMNKVFYTIFVSLILDLLAFTVILPLLPSLLDYYSENDKSGLYAVIKNSISSFRNFVGAPDTARWNSVLFGGLVGSLFSMLQFLTAPIIGAASDVYGRKPLMIVCLVGIVLSYVLWALSNNFLVFILARIVGGLSKGNISLSTAIITDVSTTKNRGKGMALVGIAFSIGFVFGPTIGAAFSKLPRDEGNTTFFLLPALFALTLACADLLYISLFLKETLPPQKRLKSKSVWSHAAEYINPLALFRFSPLKTLSERDTKEVQQIGSIYFVYLFIFSGLEFTLPFLMHNRFDYTSVQQGKMFFYMGTIMSLVQGGYTRRVTPGNEVKVSMQGILILIPSSLLMAFANNTLLMYIGLTLFSFASATVVPLLTSLISTYGGDDEKGTIMGVFRSLGALSRALGPVLASTVYWCFGAHTCYIVACVAIFVPFAQILQLMSNRGVKKH